MPVADGRSTADPGPRAAARLQVVMGKGGVGKTSLSAALALAHTERGRRVALVGLGGDAEFAGLILAGWGEPPPGLDLLELDPRGIVDDVLRRLLPMPAVVKIVTSHPAYEAMYRIMPGVRELGLLHRLVAVTEQAYDAVVVDGLATGHGTHFLEAPGKSAGLLAGKLAERARQVDAVLRDPARTEVLLATTLEEMPVRETAELAARLRERGFPLRAVLANRHTSPLVASQEARQALVALAERDGARAVASEMGASWSTVRRMARAAMHAERRAQVKAPRREELRRLGVPVVAVPVLPWEEGRLRAMAAHLAPLLHEEAAA